MSRCDEILQRLQRQEDCDYISDLHRAYRLNGLRWTGPPKTDQPYTLEDWTKAVRYITGTDRAFSSVSEAVRFLARPPAPGGAGGEAAP